MSKKNSLSEVTFSRYSLALYELAYESDSVNEVEKQALTIVDLISKSEDLKFCIKSPTISKKELENLINSVSEKTNNDVQISSKLEIKDMSIDAPIDTKRVSSIKEAIAKGEYPVDLDKIADALLQAYSDIK